MNVDTIVQGEQYIRSEIAAIDGRGNDATAKDAEVATVLRTVLEAMARGLNFYL